MKKIASALLFFCIAGFSVPLGGLFQTSWIAKLELRTALPYSTSTLNVKKGDRIRISVDCRPGPKGPAGEKIRITTQQGFQKTFELSNGGRGDAVYLSKSNSEVVGAKFIAGWDNDDVATVRIGIEPRSNLIAKAPVQDGNGDLKFGYRVGSRSWDPLGNYVTVDLYYAKGKQRLDKIAEKTLRVDSNADESFTIPTSQVPPVPNGATHLMTVIDRNDVVAESNEEDNIAIMSLPNLSVIPPVYEPSGDIKYGYKVEGAYANTIHYVTLSLHYAKGPKLTDIIQEIPSIHESTLNLNPGTEKTFEIKVGAFPLPRHDATHVVAVIDRHNVIREGYGGELDNTSSMSSQMAPGYKLKSAFKGVGVYEKKISGRSVYATVVFLSDAQIKQKADSEGYSRLNTWWDDGAATDSETSKLKAMVNGTFFEFDWTEKQSGVPQQFPYGLKVDGTILDVGKRTSKPSNYPVLLSIGSKSVAILAYELPLMNDVRYKDLVGGISGLRPTGKTGDKRQWLGVRDYSVNGPRGEPRFSTLIALTMQHEIPWGVADKEMESFGVPNNRWLQIDGGGSVTLLDSRKPLASPTLGRLLPHVIYFYGGR